jgi:RNA polymerase sigma factor (sigma-70 family)
MAIDTLGAALRQLNRLFAKGVVAGLSDAQLLERFLTQGDAGAFEALVGRHGPMVLSVCRGILRDPHDAEDAFQATFLVLVKKGGTIRGRDALAGWLHKVAHRVAIQANTAAARRRTLERRVGQMAVAASTNGPAASDELLPALHEEIARLPEKLRLAVVHCDLEGMTQVQAAAQLHWSERTIHHRLAEGRARLKRRLARRGLEPDGAILGTVLLREARAAVPAGWSEATVRAALATLNRTMTVAVVSTAANQLSQEVFKLMLLQKLTMTAATLAAAGLIAWGASAARVRLSQEPSQKLVATSNAPPQQKTETADSQPRPSSPDPSGKSTIRDRVLAPAIGPLALRVLSAKTGAPLEGVSVSFELQAEGKPRKETVKTGKDGATVIECPAGITIHSLRLDVKKPGYVAEMFYWGDRKHSVSLPESQEVRLELGEPISGVVQDEAGKPIAGVTVTAMSTASDMEEPRFIYDLGTTKTDEQGRWRIDDAPAGLSPVSLHISHPEYLHPPGSSPLAREQLTVLTQGATVNGRVVDGSGKPVKGAQVHIEATWDQRRPVATDERGEYTLRNREAGSTFVTAQAEGFAPEFREIMVPNRGKVEAPVIRLGKASTLRVKVVDRAGNPVARAYVGADTWRGQRLWLSVKDQPDPTGRLLLGQTDAAGHFTWTSAPSDTVLYDIFKDGYMRKRLVSLTASDQEHVVALDRELVISGTVTDATTGQPVSRFRVIPGQEQLEGREGLWWSQIDAMEYTGGRYSIKFDFPMKAQHVRIEASGYEPADSRAFHPDEGTQVHNFALKPAAGVSGVLLLPDGRPAAGVKVALGTQEDQIILEDGLLDRRSNVPTAITGPEGRFTFPKRSGPFLLVAVDQAGFADASREDFEKTGKLVLQPWGRIEGEVWVGRKPIARQQVSLTTRTPTGGTGIFAFGTGGHTASDEQGRFVFERVIPGPVAVSRDVMTMLPSGANNQTWCWQDAGDVQPGGTVKLNVGAKGRTVVGRVVLEGTSDDPVDWRRNEPVQLQPTEAVRIKATRQWNTFAANLDETGRFRIEDVVPGTYGLNIPVDWPLESTPNGLPNRIGEGTATVTIPEGPENQPVDIGDVKARLYLKVGRLAPDFNAPRLDGGPFKMSDKRGKLVLLDFWATWCQPCRAEMPALKDIQATFGSDPRFLLVGVSCDETAEAPAKYTKENAFFWTQVHGGKIHEGVAETYLIRGIPATFLIAPDGRVLAMNLRGQALKEAVRNALNDQKLFPTAR